MNQQNNEDKPVTEGVTERAVFIANQIHWNTLSAKEANRNYKIVKEALTAERREATKEALETKEVRGVFESLKFALAILKEWDDGEDPQILEGIEENIRDFQSLKERFK